jgi:intracellular sulfur oxidation DsrE/DsrF family protein
MTSKGKFSEEFLNAFVDEQLTTEERELAYQTMASDSGLNMQVCELRKVRDLVRLAYQDPPNAPPSTGNGIRSRRIPLVAATLVLAVLSGALLLNPAAPPSADRSSGAAPRVTVLAGAHSNETKVLLHLNSGKLEHMREVLDEAENLVRYYKASGQIARVLVITNGEGLRLLRADTSPYAERIGFLLKRYDNLTIAACQNTIDRLKRDQGIVAKLLPGTATVDSGVAQIILRQQQGWAYIQV